MATNGTMQGLPADLIASLMANTRTRNAYGPKVVEFCDSDEAAINPKEAWPVEFGNKKATTLYQGFRLAVEKAELKDVILVKQADDNVFLLHKERAHIVVETLLEEVTENGNGN